MLKMLAVLLSSKPHPGALHSLVEEASIPQEAYRRTRLSAASSLTPSRQSSTPRNPVPISSHKIKVRPSHKAIFLKGCSNKWQNL